MVLGSWVDKEKGIKTFREFIKSDRFSKDQAGVDKMLMDYRAYLLRCMDDPTSRINSPNTFNDKTKFCKQFIVWCWKSSVLKDQPRRLEDFAVKLHVEKKGHPLNLDDIAKLWAAAGPKMKCYIAMGLNFGFKNGDITSTTGKMIRGKRLGSVGKRCIWPITDDTVSR